MIGRHRLLLAIFLVAQPGCTKRPPAPYLAPTTSHAADGPIAFEDITAAWGLTGRLGHEGRSPLTILDTAGGGGGFLDFDADGWLDILVVGERRLWLFRNTGQGRLTDVSAETGLATLAPVFAKTAPGAAPRWMGCAVGDPNNDGFPDIYVTGYHGSLLLENVHGKAFREVGAIAGVRNESHWETSAVFFDANGDGREDLYVARYVRFGPGDRQTCRFRGIEAACPPHYYPAEKGVFYRNAGGMRFTDQTRPAGFQTAHGKALGVAVSDIDSDGRPDLYLANDGVAGDHFRNAGAGRFTEVGAELGTAYTAEGRPHAGMGADWGDVNNDLRPDLIVTAFQHEGSTLYINEGKQGFEERGEEAGLRHATQNRLGFGAKFGDFDNDGRLDLLLANGHVQDTVGKLDEGAAYAQRPQIFRQTGKERFADVSASGGAPFAQAIVGRGLSVGDLDNDGFLDALLIDAEGAPRLLRNRSSQRQSDRHWLGLRLIGSRSPRIGTGAVVTVQIPGQRFRREAGAGGSYLSASDPRLHLGLGSENVAQTVTIRWPSGTVDRGRDLPADRWYTVEEGRGIPRK